MTAGNGTEDEAWRSTLAEGRLLLQDARRRLEANRLEIDVLRRLLSEANARFKELQQLVAKLNRTFGGDLPR